MHPSVGRKKPAESGEPEGVSFQMQFSSAFRSPKTLIVAILVLIMFASLIVAAKPAAADLATPKLSGGIYSTCAIYPSTRLYCWGSNSSQQLGYGGGNRVRLATRPYPVKAVTTTPVGVSAGYSSACAMLVNGTIGCWGKNTTGSLGVKNAGGYARGFTAAMSLIAPWAAPSGVASGAGHICVRDNNATVKCQGENKYGQLGNASNAASAVPVQAAVISGATAATQANQVVAGASHSCALLENKNVKCWGLNNFRQLGTPTNSVPSVNSPVDVPNLANNITELASMADHSCAVHVNDEISCWGANPYGQLGDGTVAPFKGAVTVSGISNAREVSTGVSHSCALVAGGAVKCWGSNEFGQLGNGTTTTATKPVSVIGLTRPAIEITVGGYHSCARLDTQELYCWGRDNKGQLGDGSTSDSPVPRRVQSFGGVHFASVALTAVGAASDFRAKLVALPPRLGKLSSQCRTNAHLKITIVQGGVTYSKRLIKRFRRSGQTKCSASFSAPTITPAVGPATVTLKGGYKGNSTMPGASYTQTYNLP